MIEIRNLSKVFKSPTASVTALSDINFRVNDGEIFGIIGLSGAGKSTLVRCINLLETPTTGEVLIDGTDITKIKEGELRSVRRNIGMIFQSFNLLSQRNVLDNVTFPLEIAGVRRNCAVKKAKELIDIVGLTDRIFNYPSQLSGGQKQRVAIARALATDPKYLLCDEATSALDPTTTTQILELLQKINRERGVTVIVITHEMRVIEQICSRVAVLDKSHIVEIGNVAEIFANPRSDMAKELILPRRTSVSGQLSSNAIRITFDGHSSSEPVLADLILECRCKVNIMYADTKDINGSAVGQMLLQLPEDSDACARIEAYLTDKGVKFTREVL